jgi:hypothetical protein
MKRSVIDNGLDGSAASRLSLGGSGGVGVVGDLSGNKCLLLSLLSSYL